MDRRAFLKTGLICATTMATGVSLYGCSDLNILDTELIDDDVAVALSAILPVFLAPVLPQEAQAREQKIQRTIRGIKLAMSRLPPHILDELKDLFGLLNSRLANLAFAGNFAQMVFLTVKQRINLIESWRISYLSLLNTAYEGLKELVFAAFYGNPDNWVLLDYHKPDLGV